MHMDKLGPRSRRFKRHTPTSRLSSSSGGSSGKSWKRLASTYDLEAM